MRFGQSRTWLRWFAYALAIYGASAVCLWVWLPPSPFRTISMPETVSSVGISFDNRALVAGPGSWYRAWCRLEIIPSEHLLVVSRDDFGRLQECSITHASLLATGQTLSPIPLEAFVHQSLGYVAFSADGKSLAFTERGQTKKEVVLWDIPSRKTRAILKNQDGPLAFSPDGKSIATIASDFREPTVRVWRSDTGAEHPRLEAPQLHCRVDKDLSVGAVYLGFATDGSRVGMWRHISSLERARALAFGEPMTFPGVAVDAALTLVRM
jgi:WD40 repeat protein